jgi:hypothetical protein
MSQAASARWSRLIGPAVILLAAAIAVAPQFYRGVSCGHDFDFHLLSWFDAQHCWRQGILYPQWTPSPNFGAGEPRFIFYPPLTWMLGAALGSLMQWDYVPLALIFLFLAATGLATRALARQALADGPATLAACAAIFSGYTLFTAYERSAFGELTGGFWIPLLLLFVLRDRNPSGSLLRRAFDGSTAPLAGALAGAWLSNAPLGVMASYLLAAVAVAAAILSRSWAPVLRAAAGAVLGLGLASIYLVPAIAEQSWADLKAATGDVGSQIQSSWLFARHSSPDLAFHDTVLLQASIIGVTMAAIAVVGVIVSWRRGTLPAQRRWWVPLALIPVAVLVLQFPVSQPIWNTLPKLSFLQFPWRWLVVLEAPLAIFFASAVWFTRLWPRIAVVASCSAAFAGATVVAGLIFYQPCDADDAVPGMLALYQTGAGVGGSDEYQPPGSDVSLVATGLPSACLVTDPTIALGQGAQDLTPVWQPDQHSCDATFTASLSQVHHLRVSGVTPHAGYLILRLRSYPAWRVTVNGHPAGALPSRDDGLMAVPVPQGPVDLAVDWTTTTDVIAGRLLSAFALLLVTALCLLERKLTRPRLS